MRSLLDSVFIAVVCCTPAVFADDAATGALVANGDKVQLANVVVENSLGEVGLLITDQPLPSGCGVYDAFMLAGSGKLRGIAVSISKETKQKEPAGLNALFHDSWGGQLGNIGEPEFTIEQYDDNRLKGAIQLDAGSLNDHKFSYSVQFDVGLKTERPALEATLIGKTESEPAKAYIAYYQAMMAGQLDEGKKFAVKEHADQITGEDAELFLEFFQDGHPREATILGAEETGDQAVLRVEGIIPACQSADKGTATVNMVKEDGSWKVQLESWKM